MPLQMDAILSALKAAAPMTLRQIAETELALWRHSPKREGMIDGQRYYETQNDILFQHRQAIGPDGRSEPAKNVADNHLAHGFLGELTDQKIQYLLGKPYSLECADSGFLARVQALLGEGFRPLLMRTARDAVNKGIGWIQAFYDEAGNFGLKRLPPEEVLPFWADAEHTELDGLIRAYPVEVYEGTEKTVVEKVVFWTKEGVEYYERRGGGLRPDPDRRSGPHLRGADGRGYNWERLPFAALKYNDLEQPLLARIRTLVDEYDRIATNDSNMLCDQPNSILVLRNYDGADLGEFRRNLSAYRAVKVSDDGGVEALSPEISVAASAQHLEQIRRDIYAFGRGVDTRNERLSGAPSGVALQHEYAQLDLDCNQLEAGVQSAFSALVWFAAAALSEQPKEIRLILNRDILISEEAAVNMCAQSAGILSEETILANHPWVEDVEEELGRLSKEREAGGSYAGWPDRGGTPDDGGAE